MKTLITIEDGKVSVQVDDQKPIEVNDVLPPPVAEPPVQAAPIHTDRDPLVVVPAADWPPITTDDRRKVYSYPKPTKFANKACVICGEPYAPKRGNQTLCGKPECKREKQRQYAAKHSAKQPADPPFTLDDPEPAEPEILVEAPAAGVELRSRCCQAKVEEYIKPNGKLTHTCLGCGHLCGTHEYLPGHEKTAEEIASWKPIVPGSDGYSAAPRDSVEENRQRRRP